MRLALGVCICVLVLLFVFSPIQQALGQKQRTLTITIQAQPPSSPLSFGIYSTRFPVIISILIRNLASDDFPGGNVTGMVTTPTITRYGVSLNYVVPELSSGQSANYSLLLTPAEPGLYTVSLYAVYFSPNHPQPNWAISDGFLAFDVEPPSTLIELWSVIAALGLGLTSVFVSVVVTVLWPSYRERRRTRQLDEKRKVAAYRLLSGILWRMAVISPATGKARVTPEDLGEIDQILAHYHDVLDDTTIMAWDAKVFDVIDSGFLYMDLGRFQDDVRVHYERFSKTNPYHMTE